MITWPSYIGEIGSCLSNLSIRDDSGKDIDVDAAFLRLQEITIQVREQKKSVFLIGNGASASMASHVAADLTKNAHVRTEVFSDLSLITAIANDMSYEQVFAEPLRRRMCNGDMLVAISSSGQSQNILAGVREALRLGGTVTTLSAMRPDNDLRSLGSLNFYIQSQTYGLAESCHATILHYWIDQMVECNGHRATG